MRRFIVLVLFAGCATVNPGEEIVHSLRRWPMDVPSDRNDDVEPVTWTVCGKVYYCCMEMRCEDGST